MPLNVSYVIVPELSNVINLSKLVVAFVIPAPLSWNSLKSLLIVLISASLLQKVYPLSFVP